MLSLKTGEAVKYDGDAGITLAGGNSSKLISGAARISTSVLCCFVVVKGLCGELSKLTRDHGGMMQARQVVHLHGALPKSCCNCKRAMLAASRKQKQCR